jgi:Protein of unknown function (DUF3096)
MRSSSPSQRQVDRLHDLYIAPAAPARGPAKREPEQRTTLRRTGLSQFHAEALVMSFNLSIAPLISLLAGILILIVPRLLNYIVAIYLIIIGLIGLLGPLNL